MSDKRKYSGKEEAEDPPMKIQKINSRSSISGCSSGILDSQDGALKPGGSSSGKEYIEYLIRFGTLDDINSVRKIHPEHYPYLSGYAKGRAESFRIDGGEPRVLEKINCIIKNIAEAQEEYENVERMAYRYYNADVLPPEDHENQVISVLEYRYKNTHPNMPEGKILLEKMKNLKAVQKERDYRRMGQQMESSFVQSSSQHD